MRSWGADWGHMSVAARDAAYSNSGAVPDAPTLHARRIADSLAFRAAHMEHVDLPYGPRPRNKIDLYPAANPTAPCLVLFHGGYWLRNTREEFACLIAGVHAHGWSAALPGYTLAPDATLTEIVAETHAALDWLQANAAAHGVCGKLILSGWSAGGHLTAIALGHPAVSAGFAVSGVFDLGPLRDVPALADLHLTDAEAETLSPLRLPVIEKPLAIAYGSAELPPFVADSRDLHAHRAAHHAPGALIPVAGANHFTIVQALQSPDGVLTKQLLAMA